jgi:hypothetical protein
MVHRAVYNKRSLDPEIAATRNKHLPEAILTYCLGSGICVVRSNYSATVLKAR